MSIPLRGQIWLVNLDPTIGAEIKKTRPALVISNDINNQYALTITVLPISDRGEKVFPFEVELIVKESGLSKPSKVKSQQIRTVDKSRLVKYIGKINQKDIERVEQAILIHLGIDF